jgi:hypothetical protein
MTDLPLIWILLGIVLLIAVLNYRSARRKRSYSSSGVDVNADLLHACRGDRAMAERLIAHEQPENSELSRTGAALMALVKLRDDQR